ncbi:glycosyl hydrolase, partial [Helicosporidium sp. ATCC 50920]
PPRPLRRDSPTVCSDNALYDYALPSKDSHSFLESGTFGSESLIRGITPSYLINTTRMEEMGREPSEHARWMAKDLSPWAGEGISAELVGSALDLGRLCSNSTILVSIRDGKLHASLPTEPQLAQDALRLHSMLLNILETLRTFPGAVPDLELVLLSGDQPCVRKKWAHGALPMPVFGRQGSVRHHDLPLPDFGLWAGGESPAERILAPSGEPILGWDQQSELLREKYGRVSSLIRVPQVFWRGPPSPTEDPDTLRHVFASCAASMNVEDRAADAALFNSGPFPALALQEACDFRYSAHIEAQAHPQTLRHRLACGSLVLSYSADYWEWWTRALEPGTHFIRLFAYEQELCSVTVRALNDLNILYGTVGKQALRDGRREPTPSLRDTRFRLINSSVGRPLMRRIAPDDAPVPSKAGRYSWNSDKVPWQLSWEGQQFIANRVKAEHALLYTRDMLRAYAALLRYAPAPKNEAPCYDGQVLLDSVKKIDAEQAAALFKAYPWLPELGRC